MKSDGNINTEVLKKLQDSYSAEYLYTSKINDYNLLILINNLLAFSVPLIVLTSLYLTKGSDLEPLINIISTISSLILLILTGVLFITGIPDKKERFIVARRINRRMQKDCRKNLYNDNDLSDFFNHIHDIDDDDLDKLGSVSKTLKQESYTYALEKLGSIGLQVACAECGQEVSKNENTCDTCGTERKKIE